MATISAGRNSNISFIGCLLYGPFEVANLRTFTIGKTYVRTPVEVLRPADSRSSAIVRYIGGEGAFSVSPTRLEPVA